MVRDLLVFQTLCDIKFSFTVNALHSFESLSVYCNLTGTLQSFLTLKVIQFHFNLCMSKQPIALGISGLI